MQNAENTSLNSTFDIHHSKVLGVYSSEVHLFPFRTEKLSPLALMVLPF